MKTTMKKFAATLLAIILVLQVVPVLADTVESNALDPIDELRPVLTVQSKVSVILVGETIDLSATAGYTLTWKSDNEKVAEVDADSGHVVAVAPGTVKITASEGQFSDSITLKVIEQETVETGAMTIVINAPKEKFTYDGQEHVSGFTPSSNVEFDPDKVKMVNTERVVTAKDCGVYQIKYLPSDFEYEGDENVEFIISDGWFQIKPANVTVKANDVTQTTDEVPEFTATVTGLVEGDDPESIQYTFEVYTAGDVTYIAPVCETLQGNYRVTAQAGVLVVENGIYREVRLTSDWPAGEPAYAGTMITMRAELIGFENVDYTLQWQHSIDREEWINEPGANDTTFTFELNETTVQYTWRVVANY